MGSFSPYLKQISFRLGWETEEFLRFFLAVLESLSHGGRLKPAVMNQPQSYVILRRSHWYPSHASVLARCESIWCAT